MSYPATLDTYTAVAGTTLEATADHANMHNVAGSAVVNIETTLGTNSGTSVLLGFAAGNFALPVNSSSGLGTLQRPILGTLSMAAGTFTGTITNSAVVTGGTISSPAIGTPTMDFVSARNAGTGIGFNNAIYPVKGTVADSAGGTLTVDARAAQIYFCTMGTAAGNRTIATPTNLSPEQLLIFAFKASGSANGTLVWGTIFRVSSSIGTPLLGTSGWSYYNWRYNSTDSKLDFQGQTLNLG